MSVFLQVNLTVVCVVDNFYRFVVSLFPKMQFIVVCIAVSYLHHFSCCITECTGAAFLILFVLGSGLGLTLLPPPPGTKPWSQRTRARDGASVAEFSTNQSPAAGALTNHRREAAALHLRLPLTRKTNCDKGLSLTLIFNFVSTFS